ncbi:hypothetical protein ACFL2C_02010 [Patescibacteria group bacterium]
MSVDYNELRRSRRRLKRAFLAPGVVRGLDINRRRVTEQGHLLGFRGDELRITIPFAYSSDESALAGAKVRNNL